MKRVRKPYTPESPTAWEVLAYLRAELCKRIKWQNDWDQPFITVGIGLACPRHHVDIAIHSLTLDRQAAIILNDLGIPDALATSRSNRNFNDEDYLSISMNGLSDFGKANKEKILEWVAVRKAQKPVMQQLHDLAVDGGFDEKLDSLLNAAVPASGGAS
jgi:hypothetical protein